MKNSVAVVLSVVGILSACAGEEVLRPLAFAGAGDGVRAFQMDVTSALRAKTVSHADKWLDPAEYGKYAVVMIEGYPAKFAKAGSKLWAEPGATEAVRKYVENGGVVLLVGWAGFHLVKDNPAAQDLVGVKRFTGCSRDNLELRLRGNERNWLWSEAVATTADILHDGTETLIEGTFPDGHKSAFATRRKLGEGTVYWVSPSCGMLDMRFSALKKSLGDADDKGAFVPTPEGESVTMLRKFYSRLLAAVKTLDCTAPANDWGLTPLGAKGDIDTTAEFKNLPVYRKPPTFGKGIRFWNASARGVVVGSGKKAAALAGELAWHLSKMVGGEVKAVKAAPSDASVPTIRVVDDPELKPYGTSAIRTEGTCMTVTGSGAGLSYAVTYLLEALGCRYLWPGASGKVIPKRAEIDLPDLANWSYAPALKFREMREFRVGYSHDGDTMQSFWGIDDEAYRKFHDECKLDRKGNRDFYKWHGVNDERDFPGSWRWGHYFGDYWKKYGEEHPDWFALQPNGSRFQELGNRQERPTLCTSNPGLIEQAAKDAVAAFKRNPSLRSFSVCLPDGGAMSQCMCSGCRSLDPVNAAASQFYVGAPWWRKFPYVELTDRMLTFDNAIAERVVKECPDAKIGVYIYSMYEKPSVKVKPHPALVLLTVAGGISSPAARANARNNIAYWSRYENMLLWRPNTFFQFSVSAPQNYARFVFEDVELFKRNHVIGTDFDCVNAQFATKGLIWYLTVKAHRNPDEIGYEDYLADYCRSGFGAAAEDVKAYFDLLEAISDATCGTSKTTKGEYLSSGNDLDALDRYLVNLDVDRLGKILDAAEAKVAGDEESLRRVRYLKFGLETGRAEKRLGAAWTAKDGAAVRAAQEELRKSMARIAFEDPFAVCPVWMTGTYHSPHMRAPRFK